MAREIRVQDQGFYYVFNRRVEYKTLFYTNEDYTTFLHIVCQLAKVYDFTLHGYALLISSYHLVIQTKENNLSKIMKQLNGQYSQYFNRTYKRSGTLWEGRYRSQYIIEENYSYHFLKYVEQLPQKTRMVNSLERYYFSSYSQLSCIKGSIIFQRFNTIEEIKDFFSEEVTQDEIDNISHILRQRIQKSQIKKSQKKDTTLTFKQNTNKEEDDKNIVLAYKNGFSQKEIALYLGVSQQAIQKRLKRLL